MNEMRLGLYINMAKATPNNITLLQDYLYAHSTPSCIYTLPFSPKVLETSPSNLPSS